MIAAAFAAVTFTGQAGNNALRAPARAGVWVDGQGGYCLSESKHVGGESKETSIGAPVADIDDGAAV
jgi:hypothetical protein